MFGDVRRIRPSARTSAAAVVAVTALCALFAFASAEMMTTTTTTTATTTTMTASLTPRASLSFEPAFQLRTTTTTTRRCSVLVLPSAVDCITASSTFGRHWTEVGRRWRHGVSERRRRTMSYPTFVAANTLKGSGNVFTGDGGEYEYGEEGEAEAEAEAAMAESEQEEGEGGTESEYYYAEEEEEVENYDDSASDVFFEEHQAQAGTNVLQEWEEQIQQQQESEEPVDGDASRLVVVVNDDEENGHDQVDGGINGVDESPRGVVVEEEEDDDDDDNNNNDDDPDSANMRVAIQLAQSRGGQRGARSSFPKPMVGAVIVAKDGTILGQGRSSYKKDAIRAAIADAGIVATPLREWCISWPSDRKLRETIRESTLYVTLEPSTERQGTQVPPITQLIAASGIPRVVIGCQDPVPEQATVGAASLHAAGLSVTMGVEQKDCEKLISEYTKLAMSKLHRMARKHFGRTGRPLGFLHCSVVDSDDIAAFASNGNAFGRDFGGGQRLSFRDFGTYELAPPPESIWASDNEDEESDLDIEVDDFFNMEFEEEDWQESLNKNPMMPWYEQVDACVATFPKPGNGPSDDDSVTGRLNGLKWLATYGNLLPAGVERILVMDATDLPDLPLTNDDPDLPPGVDVESFWDGKGRRPTRVLLRHGDNAAAIAAAEAASNAAASAAAAAEAAKEAIESGDAEEAAEAAMEYKEAAVAASEYLQMELQTMQDLKQRLVSKGVIVEVIKGGEPVDVMNHLGKRSGYKAVVWRAGCWGQRGVKAILDGAFQWVSAHLAVDATGGKFWQLMLAENAVQAACGPKSKVKVFSEQEDISLEYCDSVNADKDCNLTINGRPVRHVRLDCRVALVDVNRPRKLSKVKTRPIADRMVEEAPWFI